MSDGWSFGQRYNSSGEWNPRLITCDNCHIYYEPEEIEECVCGECQACPPQSRSLICSACFEEVME